MDKRESETYIVPSLVDGLSTTQKFVFFSELLSEHFKVLKKVYSMAHQFGRSRHRRKMIRIGYWIGYRHLLG